MKEYTRILACGNKEVKISADTKAEIRSATHDEREMFQKKHWDVPDELPCQTDMWESMCEMLNNLEHYIFATRDIRKDEIQRLFLESLGIESDGSIAQFKFVPADDANKENAIQIESGYPNRKTTLCKYLQDFFPLIKAIESSCVKVTNLEFSEYSRYIREKRSKEISIEIAMAILGKNNKKGKNNKNRIKKLKNREKISCFIDFNLDEIERFREYASTWNNKKILEKKDFKAFCESDQRVLDVDGEIFFEFENDCGFDIEKKLKEIEKIKKKISDSYDPGEKDVEYAISWFRDTYGEHYMVPIKHDCESPHRYNCIWLCKPDFRDEPQEYDHILVCAFGVVLIETKNWKGIVEILPDGQLVRKTGDKKSVHGEAKTLFQVQRHEALMRKILLDVSVHSILCLPNKSVVIYGKENMKGCSVVTGVQLKEALLALGSKDIYSKEEINRMVAEIEKHKKRNANRK